MSKAKQRKRNEKRAKDVEDLGALFDELRSESDRAAIVLGGAFLDARLEALLRAFFVDRREIVDALFGPQGALTFAVKIKLCYLLGLMSDYAFNDLEVIREIRNRFAHDLQGTKLNDPEILAWARKLKLPFLLVDAKQEDVNWRGAVNVTVSLLGAELALITESQSDERRKVHPGFEESFAQRKKLSALEKRIAELGAEEARLAAALRESEPATVSDGEQALVSSYARRGS